MLSIGGITYTDDWNSALASNAAQLGPQRGRPGPAARRRHRDRLRGELRAEPDRPAGLHRRLPRRAALRRQRRQPGGPADHRRGRRRPLADRHRPQGDRGLAAHRARRSWTTPTPWCRPASRRHLGADANWQEHLDGKPQYSPADPAACPGQVHRQPLHRRGQQGPARVQQLRHLAAELHRRSCRPPRRTAPVPRPGLLGYMFWAAERPSTRGVTTTRRTPARAVSAWAPPLPSRFRCPRFDRGEIMAAPRAAWRCRVAHPGRPGPAGSSCAVPRDAPPSRAASCRITGLGSDSRYNRTARARSSSGYFFGATTIRWRMSWPRHLPALHRQLMPQHREFHRVRIRRDGPEPSTPSTCRTIINATVRMTTTAT